MNIERLAEKNSWNKIQFNMAKSMMLAGATEKSVENMVKGYGLRQEGNNLSLGCPKCNSTMRVVYLEDGRAAKYCTSDRICLPMRQ